MAEPLARIGRGGAGNYWSKADLEEAEKAGTRENEDIEAQNSPLNLSRTTTSKPLTDYSKIGRGGAGNVVYTPSSEPSTTELSRVATARNINETVVERKMGPQVYQGHGGRGGAGNWRGNLEEEKRMMEAEEERARKEMEKRVQDEVIGSLRAPERTYRVPREEEKVRK